MKHKRITTVMVAMLVGIGCVQLPQRVPAQAAEPEKLIALTFDDGPNTTTTNEVLDVLEEYDAVGSFFLIGSNINEESAVSVKRAYDMGCEINNHSRTHSYMADLSPEQLAEEIDSVNEQVYAITGEYPHFFRPPFISTSQTMYDEIDLPFICGFDCKDFMESVTAKDRSDAILSAAKDGLIVLLHDAAGNDQTVEALKTVVPTLKEEGYRFVTLSELFALQGETPKGNLIYSEVAKYPCDDYTPVRTLYSGSATGDSSWPGWSSLVVLDAEELTSMGDRYAIEVAYESTNPPVIALQQWTGDSFWQTVLPFYSNGERACFLAKDVMAALAESGKALTELDKISVVPYGGTMTLTGATLLQTGQTADPATELRVLMRYLVREGTMQEDFDVNADGMVNALDVVARKQALLTANE